MVIFVECIYTPTISAPVLHLTYGRNPHVNELHIFGFWFSKDFTIHSRTFHVETKERATKKNTNRKCSHVNESVWQLHTYLIITIFLSGGLQYGSVCVRNADEYVESGGRDACDGSAWERQQFLKCHLRLTIEKNVIRHLDSGKFLM